MAAETKNIPLVAITDEAWLNALKGGARTANAATRARIDREAALCANTIAQQSTELIRTLSDAVERLQAARSPKEAAGAAAWLRCDTWDRMRQGLVRLETLASVLD